MIKYISLLLFIGLAFWSCEDTTPIEPTIIGLWDYYYYSQEYEEHPDWNHYNENDSVVYNFTDNGTLTVVDSRNNDDGNESGTEYWGFTSESDSIRIYDDTGDSPDNYDFNWFYQLSNDSLMISRLHTIGNPCTIKKYFTRVN